MPIINLVYESPAPVTVAGIYHSAEKGLISLSTDGSTWTTIADKNLWATTVYNDWDTLSEANCGKYYQRWNNYGFAFTWPTTIANTQINPSDYWPWNYYSSSTFIWGNQWWMSTVNSNLWGNTTDTLIARRWPCAEWYHIPSQTEANALLTMWINIWAWTSWAWTGVKNNLLIPYSNMISWDGVIYSQWTSVGIWTSTWSSGSATNALAWILRDSLNIVSAQPSATWKPIRPFKNEWVQPDYSWTVLYQ